MERPGLRAALIALLLVVSVRGASAQQCRLAYGNGALIPNVKVVAIFWGTTNNGQYQYKDKLEQYYDAVTNSPYFDWLIEYNTSSYKIGRGVFAASYADPAPPAKTTITESGDLQPYLSQLIDGGKVPAPDGNTLYFLHLPGSVTVSGGGAGTTCQDNCAYHSFFTKGTQEVRYAVIPDQNSGPCSTNQACPLALAALDRLTIVAAHELVEAVTDPNGSGWIDNNQQCGEIGDICVGQAGKAAGFTVQLEWSNKRNQCIDHDDSVVFDDFTLALSPASASAPAGGSASLAVTATPTAGAQPTPLSLTVALPVGLTGSFASASIQSNASTTLALSLAPSLAPGSYPLSVTGVAGNGAHHTATGMLTVSAAVPDMATPGGLPGEGGGAGNGVGGNGSGSRSGDRGGGCSIAGGVIGGVIGAGAGWWILLMWPLFALRRRR